METTDLHMHVFAYDYYSDQPRDTVGLARTAGLIAEIRAEAANSILLDNGDFLQGNPMGDYIAYGRGMKEGDSHPIILALNSLGYDGATIGNHEFNYGLDFLMKSLSGANFPVVSCNVVKTFGSDPTRDVTLLKPYVILDRQITDGSGHKHGIKIGLIGFVPPQIMTWDRHHLEGKVNSRDIVDTAQAYVPQMKEAGADIIIALSHSGIGPARHTDGMENASVPLARVAGIDALVTGHSHLVFPSAQFDGHAGVDVARATLHGKPATMAGFWGSHLGVIDLMLERDAGEWRVLSTTTQVRPIWKYNADRAIRPLVQSVKSVLASATTEHQATLAYVRRGVGTINVPLHSYFALVAGAAAVLLVAHAQEWYIRDMMEGTEYHGLPILSAAAPFKAGGRGGADYYTDVAAGNVAIKNVADLYIYPNTVRAVKVTGAQLRDWLERSAGMFNQITPGQADQRLLNDNFPSYYFDVIHGVSYQIDLSQPSKYDTDGGNLNLDANRIVNLTYKGTPVADDMEFVVATNNYRASGGGDFPGAKGDTIIFEAPDTNRDVMVRYIMQSGSIELTAASNWAFAPLDGTPVLYDTSPAARRHLNAVRGLKIKEAGDAPNGFARFRILI